MAVMEWNDYTRMEEPIIWLRCPKDGCDPQAFKVFQSTVDDAGGEIWCDICETPCIEVFWSEQLNRWVTIPEE